MAIRKAADPAQAAPAPGSDITTAGAQIVSIPVTAALPPPAPEVPAIAASVAPVPAVPAPVPAVAAPVPAVPAPVVATQFEVHQKMESVMKTAEEFVTFGQGNIEAFVKAGQIWASGVQEMTKQLAATAQAQMDQTVATFKALSGVKSLKEAVDLQTTHARATVEKAVSETGKLTDASLKLTEQTLAPITARVTLAMEKFGRAA